MNPPNDDDITAKIIWALRSVLAIIREALVIVILAAIIVWGYSINEGLNDLKQKLPSTSVVPSGK